MDAYFISQRKESNILAFRYFIKLVDPPLSKHLNELNFMTKLFGFQHQFKGNPQDRDMVTEVTGDLLSALFSGLYNTAVITLFRPDDLKINPESNPRYSLDQLYAAGKKIMSLAQIKDPRRRITRLADLLDEVNAFVESVFLWSNINNFMVLTELYGEMKRFWKDLYKQRREAYRLQPSLQRPLEETSVFPLLYKPSECTTNLVELLNSYDVRFKPTHIYNLPAIRKKIEKLVNILVIYHNKTFKQVEEMIAKHTNCKTEDININNMFTLNKAILNSVKPPTYRECWLRTNYQNPKIRNLLYTFNHLEDFVSGNMEKLYDQYRANEDAKHQVKGEEEDEVEVIIPDFLTMEPIPKEELISITEENPLEETSSTQQYPILTALLQKPTTTCSTEDNGLNKWLTGRVNRLISTTSTSTPTSTTTSTPTTTTSIAIATTVKTAPGLESIVGT
jgi:hypothetical protein